MTRLWTAWVELISTKEPATMLALMRIGIAVTVFVHMAMAWTTGAVDLVWVDAAFGGYRNLGDGSMLVAALGGPNPDVVYRVLAANLFFSAALAVGVGGRVTAFLVLQTYLGLTGLNGHTGGSYDPLTTNALWLLVLAPSTYTLSVDCKLRTGAWTDNEPVSAFVRYLAIFQLFLVYWTTGLQKLSFYWVPGGDFSALYYIFQQPTWQRVDMEWVAWVYPLTQIGTGVTWFWEVGMPLLLLSYWFRYTADRGGRVRDFFNRWDVRSWFVALGLTFHVLVHVFMNVGPFSFVSLAYFPCFYTPDELKRSLAWLRERFGVANAAAPTTRHPN